MTQWNVLDLYHGDNKEEIPDYVGLKAIGCRGIIHKCTQGSNYADPLFAARITAAVGAGLQVAAYHFGDNSPVQNQIANFHRHNLGLFSFLDFEHNANSTMTLAQARAFMVAMPIPAIYGSDMIKENAKALSLALAPALYPWLWIAQYGPVMSIPSPWSALSTIGWQFSETGGVKGIAGHIDLNYFPDLSRWGKPCNTL